MRAGFDLKISLTVNLASAAILVAAFALHVFAGVRLRGLYGDGPYIFLLMLQGGGQIVRSEPARWVVHFAQQLPTYFAVKLGARDLIGLATVYSVTMELLAWIFVAGCYVILPKQEKPWFVFPLFQYLAGTLAAAFEPLAEGPVATAFFWFLLFLIVFRSNRLAGQLGTFAIGLLTLRSHEVMVFLAPFLALAAAWRARAEPDRRSRLVFMAMAAWFVAVAATQIWFTVYAADEDNRASFVASTLALRFVAASYGVNVPTILGLLAFLVLLAVLALRGRFPGPSARWASIVLMCAFACVCLGAIMLTIDKPSFFFTPSLQFEARNYGAFLSVPLAALFFASLARPALRSLWVQNQVVGILLILASGQLGWHAVGLGYWSAFLAEFRSVLASHRGLVSASEAEEAGLEPMSWPWTYPSLSIVLSPKGEVVSMIAPPPDGQWQPFDPVDLRHVPRSSFFNLAPYRQNLLAQQLGLAPR